MEFHHYKIIVKTVYIHIFLFSYYIIYFSNVNIIVKFFLSLLLCEISQNKFFLYLVTECVCVFMPWQKLIPGRYRNTSMMCQKENVTLSLVDILFIFIFVNV